MAKESIQQTFGVSLIVCAVCSVVVSAMAVALRPIQEANRELDRQRNVLVAAGLLTPGESATRDQTVELFRKIESIVVDIESGRVVPDKDAARLDWDKLAQDPDASQMLSPTQDLARIRRRSDLRPVYLYRENGELKRVILPVYGKGLWSTMYGFLALNADLETIGAITFYEHAETPGLGGEIDNPNWKAQWVDKLAFDERGNPAIEVVKGRADPRSPHAAHEVDGLSGATLTARGVGNLVRFWLGPDGYGPYIERLRAEQESL